MFGFGFNKTKASNNAERYVKQGKLHNAIAEYEKIAKQDPTDLTVLNTVGDLYARIGDADKATEYFGRIGDAYAADGFIVKAIAMYKKLTKLNPQASGALLKLAAFYTQQGLYTDARQQYTIAGEQFLRRNELDRAANVFERMVELDPENGVLQARLAEIHMKLGHSAEARDVYYRSAAALRAKGALDAADSALSHVLTLDPAFSKGLLLRGITRIDNNDPESGIKFLEQAADLDSHPEGLRALLKALLKLQRFPEAEPIARKLLSVFNDPAGVMSYCEALFAAGAHEAAIRAYSEAADRLLAWNSAAVLEMLHGAIANVKTDARGLEALCNLFQQAGDSSHLTEVTELLAHACVQEHDLPRARDLYKKLTEMEPSNPQHLEHYRQIVAQLGDSTTASPLSADDGDTKELESFNELPPALPGTSYSKEVREAIRAAMTEADLYESYNLPSSAVLQLESVLRTVPRDPQVNCRLAILYAKMGRWIEAADRCAVVSTAYAGAGCEDDSHRFAAYARSYRERVTPTPSSETSAQLEPTPNPAAPKPDVEVMEHEFNREQTGFADRETPCFEFDLQSEAPPPHRVTPETGTESGTASISEAVDPAPVAAAETSSGSAAESVMAANPSTREIAPGTEWEDMFSAETTPTAGAAEEPEAPLGAEVANLAAHDLLPEAAPATGDSAAVSDLLDEIRFYLSQTMLQEAESALVRCEAAQPNLPEIVEMRAELARLKASGEQEREIPELEVLGSPTDEPGTSALSEFDLSEVPLPDGNAPTSEPYSAMPAPPPCMPVSPDRGSLNLGVESSTALFDLTGTVEPLIEFAAQKTAATADFPSPNHASSSLASRESNLLELPVGDKFVPREGAPEPTPATPLEFPKLDGGLRGSSGLEDISFALSDVFSEFKRDMEKSASPSAASDDVETHYNLGVAFREMGLMDEAIGEMQKVCQAVERGHPFPQVLQAFTWLADCFVQKGVPEAAIRWYERALKFPSIDNEAAVAIHYELGCAYEMASNKTAALGHFLEVYGNNIDYRDVAVRIKALKS